MKKTMSRFVCLLLAMVMVVSLMPFAMATGISASRKTMHVGDTYTLSVTDAEDTKIEGVAWTSSDHTVATVDASGLVTAVKAGSATITGTKSDVSGSPWKCEVTVKKIALKIPPNLEDKYFSYNTTEGAIKTALGSTIQCSGVACEVQWSCESFTQNEDNTFKGIVKLPDTNKYEWSGGSVENQEISCKVSFASKPEFGLQLSANTPASQEVKQNETSARKNLTAEVKNVKIFGIESPTVDQDYKVSYQWKKSSTKGGTYTNIATATAASYTPDISTLGTAWYKCEVTVTARPSNLQTVATTNEVCVTVGDAYLITTEFDDPEIYVGEKAALEYTVEKWVNGAYVPVTSGYTVDSSISNGNSYAVFSQGTLTAIGTGTNGASVIVRSVFKDSTSGDDIVTKETAISIVGPEIAKDFTVVCKNGSGVLEEDDFAKAIDALTGNTVIVDQYFEYVKFSSEQYVTLYESTTSNKKVGSTACYYKATGSEADLDGIDAVLATNKTSGSVKYTAYNKSNAVICTGTVKFSTTAAVDEIAYYVNSGKSVTFDADDFEDYYYFKKPLYDFGYVQFSLTSAKNYGTDACGYLYTDSGCTTKASSATKYTAKQLAKLTFKAGTSKDPFIVELPFYAFDDDQKNAVTGTVYIYVNGAEKLGNNKITAIGGTFKNMKLIDQMEDEFDNYFENIAYIKFSKQPTGGTLYYDYEALQDRGEKVTATDAFYLDPSTKQLDFDKLYFLPSATGRGAITIKYTAYGTNDRMIDDGEFTIYVGTKTESDVFPDVTDKYSWAADAIDVMADSKLVLGNTAGKFMPTNNMARRDLVLILYRYAGSPTVKNVRNPFVDVKTTDYAYDAILWAYDNGVVTGKSATTFNPTDNITRQEIASILWRVEGSVKTSQTLTAFSDNAKVSLWALDAMKWAVKFGLINGSNGRLNPTNPATRAEVATILYRYFLAD